MKKIVIAMMMIGLVATSYGAVDISWLASGGFYFAADPNTGILGLDNSGNSTIAQLMYSPDAIQDAGSVGGIGLNGLSFAGGNDVMWSSLTITADGSSFAGYAVFPTAQSYQQAGTAPAGFVYAMIFQDNVLNAGDWYFYTPMVSVQDITGLMTAQSLQLNNDVDFGDAINSGATTAQVIPEPATMLLFGIGGMGAWLLRRRQQA